MRLSIPYREAFARRAKVLLRSRRTWQVLGVLLVALALLSVVSKLALRATVESVALEIHTSDDNAAARLVHKLPTFGPTAYGELVEAANSKRSAVALAARDEIERLVDDWQQTARLHPASFELEGEPITLAENLEQVLPELTAGGRRWARRLLIDLVQLAKKQDFQQRWKLLRTCDRALSSLPADDPMAGFEPDVQYRLTLAPPPVLTQDAPVFVSQPRSVELSPVPNEVSLNDPPPPLPGIDANGESVELNEPAPMELAMPAAPLTPLEEVPDELMEWNPGWSADELPVARPPEETISTAETDNDGRLFELLASGTETQQIAAAKALTQLGYGSVTPLDARMMTSPSPPDRAAMVSRAMTSPRLEATKWLWRLAHDPAGQVRAAAIGAIATSGNQQLVEAAKELAIRDTDPRVAEKATLLQQMLR